MKKLMKHFKMIHRMLVPFTVWENPVMAEIPIHHNSTQGKRKTSSGRVLETARPKWPWTP